jgi:hypothetical protein
MRKDEMKKLIIGEYQMAKNAAKNKTFINESAFAD